MPKAKAAGQSEGIRNEVYAGYEIEFRLPVQGEIDGGILKFIIQPDDARRTKPGLSGLEPEISTTAIEKSKVGDAADKLMPFIEAADAQARAEGHQSFNSIGLIHEIFDAEGIVEGGGGCTEPDTHRQFITLFGRLVLCGQMIIQATDGQKDQGKDNDPHVEIVLGLSGTKMPAGLRYHSC